MRCPRTIGAADHLSRSANAPDFRRKVATCCRRWPPSSAFSPWAARPGARGTPARRGHPHPWLAGRRWLEANPDSVAVFTALYRTRMPPLLAQLDQILAGLLSSRFGAPPAAAAANRADLRVEVNSDA